MRVTLPASLVSTLYNAALMPLAGAAFALGRRFNRRLAARVYGVRHTWTTLAALPRTCPRLWVHASSMGEFEQAKPVIERLRTLHPTLQVVVSFFSPSGYEHQKTYAHADAVVYLPLDSPGNARRFLDLLRPDAAVFVRYDLWHNHLHELRRRAIPTVLICATVNPDSALVSRTLLNFTRANYGCFSAIYTAGDSETQRFREFGLVAAGTTLETAADTRFDRIAAQVEAARERPVLPHDLFAPREIVLVAGSTWEEDETLLLQAFDRMEERLRLLLRLIVVPHEPGPEVVTRLLALLPDAIRLSELEQRLAAHERPGFRHIVVDSVGTLLRLYGHAQCAYVGGGFGAGVHSVTEPAGYGIPLACGPGIARARDAVALHEHGALNVLSTVAEATAWLSAVTDSPSIREQRGAIAHRYITTGLGFSDRIARDLLALLPRA